MNKTSLNVIWTRLDEALGAMEALEQERGIEAKPFDELKTLRDSVGAMISEETRVAMRSYQRGRRLKMLAKTYKAEKPMDRREWEALMAEAKALGYSPTQVRAILAALKSNGSK